MKDLYKNLVFKGWPAKSLFFVTKPFLKPLSDEMVNYKIILFFICTFTFTFYLLFFILFIVFGNGQNLLIVWLFFVFCFFHIKDSK